MIITSYACVFKELKMNGIDYMDVIENHYHYLTNNINPDAFLFRLRSEKIISQCDQDEITNQYAYKTRRQRAGVFLDILKTKGENGFLKFKELLGWEYPHVFERVFLNEVPSDKPSGYQLHQDSRKSCDIHDLVAAGFNFKNLQGQYNDVKIQMEELKNLLVYTQQEKTELELEVERMREYESLNRQLREKLKESEKENRQVKDENRDFMRKYIQTRDERDTSATKVHELLHERDELENQLLSKVADLNRLNECQNELKENFEQERRISQRLHRQCNDLKKARTRHVQTGADGNNENNRQLQAKIEILLTDLEEERESNRTLFEELNASRDENYKQKDEINKLLFTISSLKQEAERSGIWLRKAEKKSEEYFQTIQNFQQEKRKMEEEKLILQQKNWDLAEEKNVFFQRKHELERQVERCQREYDSLKSDIMRERLQTYRKDNKPENRSEVNKSEDVNERNAIPIVLKNSTLPLSLMKDSGNEFGNTPPQSSFSTLPWSSSTSAVSDSSLLLSNDIACNKQTTKSASLKVHVGSMKKKHDSSSDENIEDGNDIKNDESDDDDYEIPMCSFNSRHSEEHYEDNFMVIPELPKTSPTFTLNMKEMSVMVKASTLSTMVLTSDREETKISDLTVENANLQPGDVLLHMDYDNQKIDFVGLPLDTVQLAIKKCIETNPKVVILYIKPGSRTVTEMLDMGQFYIRSNFANIEPVVGETTCLPLLEGEIVYVEGTYGKYLWKVKKVDQKTGRKLRAHGFIPNIEESKKLLSQSVKQDPQSTSTNSLQQGFTRKLAIRCKEGKSSHFSPYTLVLPKKAQTCLPVLIHGCEALVSAILKLLEEKHLPWAKVVKEKQSWMNLIHEDKTSILSYSLGLQPSNSKYSHCYNFIHISCPETSQELVR